MESAVVKRTVSNFERIVYTFTQDEVVEAIVRAYSTGGKAGHPTGTPHRFKFHSDGSVEFIYDFMESK